ncbi:assimilatory sulfite reductase (NADPH) hemoprotein subunit [Paenibacillus macquariensis]|uniref:Sulfite reductase [NADPH] hemoprotein beta-component n=1 Tax=Paenibacillus macquariensis TaxID=948756 RepID=A0ABY1JN69_9BACL|nr:assimilatory sulfite reductase (NADPH) hemoprotein subunit [Paenibacillus macquariensis]MEC0092211.1 assimilatory sulfite reductase (NADPH) hemoprotein subunit [Paenibacillus macquariensis]OAB37241.1 sulfite reductase [Paenibacillus macquariensis subsp. macquariensis]SIQ48859.1 sulfite reductase (NADPH) beta subunit [Paenibacillus macquariensis]
MTHNKSVVVQDGPPSDVEDIKTRSRYLRGELEEALKDGITGSMSEDENRLMKFHGSYMQDDRDLRNERHRQKLEPAYQFMVRIRAPGGVLTSEQWLAMDRLAREYTTGSIRITTRQAIQFHGILKWNLKKSIRTINDALLTTLAACGDVNRNIMCNPNPYQSEVHAEVFEWSTRISDHLSPKTNAYHEIWLDGEKIVDSNADEAEQEPIYGKVYLPRKFKIGVTVPPTNDVDVFSQDLGLIAIYEEGKLKGFNVAVGGGMGMTYGDTQTYPQLARVIGFCTPEQVIDVAEKTVMIQRDYGNRSVRKYARFKYTIDRYGMEWFINELHTRLGWNLEEARPYEFSHNGDRYGWIKGSNGKWHLTLYIPSGRIEDQEGYPLMTGLREIAKINTGDFRLSPNQNLVIGNVTTAKKRKIEELIKEYGLTDGKHHSALRRNALSCVAFPTCGMAMAEAERYLPTLLDKIELILSKVGLSEEAINIRMTGCPNGCARPALGEIAFMGKAPGKYNMYLGAGFAGERLNKIYRENIGEEEILNILEPMLHQFAQEREVGEHFGDFVIRAGYVKAVQSGLDFHN